MLDRARRLLILRRFHNAVGSKLDLKIVRTDCEQQVDEIDTWAKTIGDLVKLPEFGTTEDQLVEICKDADLILHCYTPISKRVIESGQKLKGIVKYGVGIDKIDIQAAKHAGVKVVNIPDYGDQTVAEGAFYLMITLAKRGLLVQQEMRDKGWAWPSVDFQGFDLAGKNVGIVGLGKIGKRFAGMAKGFGMRISCFDPFLTQEEMQAHLVDEKVDSIQTLCAQSDFLSIHTPLNETTRHLIGKEELRLMKPTSFLINVSRGEIVDELALVDAIQSKQIAGVGIDTFGCEPVTKEGHVMSPLLGRHNCVFTPHFAFWTREAASRLQQETIERAMEILNDMPVKIKSADPRLKGQPGCNYS